ncbi:MAG TPA: hypothetical protein VGR02_02880 [Thermoanaerobaculia bacterium]|nr:hypothetical protein [Thermoanaerobaculia bacterium]
MPAAAKIIAVPPLAYSDLPGLRITLRQRVLLHANVRRGERYQARFLRGTKAALKSAIPQLTSHGCVIIESLPRETSVDYGIVDLRFPPFSPEWVRALDGSLQDTTYVVVLEKIDQPEPSRYVRLVPAFAPSYIDRGLEIVLQAPAQPRPIAGAGFIAAVANLFGSVFPSAQAAPVESRVVPSPPPPAPPPPDMNCLEFP